VLEPLTFSAEHVEPDVAAPKKTHNPLEWRLGARVEHWADGAQIGFNGGFVTLGLEMPWGLPKTQIDVGLGGLYYEHRLYKNWFGPGDPGSAHLVLGLIDTQACPVDVPLGQTGIDVMACARFAFGVTQGLQTNDSFAFGAWVGGGARLRWQTPWKMFVDAHFSGLYGMRVEGVPALMDFGGSVGFKI
jgi:hypothetical protein